MTKSDHNTSPEDTNHSPPATAAWGTWEDLLLAYAVNRYGTKSWDSISSELQKRTSDSINLTPNHCKQKYGELKSRFNQSDENDVVWLEELRKLRVLELLRELQNYDLYISSLQSKVKKLTEESEKKSDLGNGNDEIEPAVSGEEDSERENRSVNGSNGNQSENGNEKPESLAVLPVREEPVRTGPDGEASESPESIAESKSEGKQSDVQSSASKSMKEGNDWVPRGNSKMDDQDESTDSIPVRSLPLVDFLQKLQKLGSVVFERRLDRQEMTRYTNLIKQHIDYDTLQTRLKEGWYSDGNDIFFRDLLLLVNNTRIFFPKQSPESTAAVDLRQLILNEMISKKKQKTDSKRPTNTPDSLLLKPTLTSPIAVCRKRSSITAKGKKEQTDSEKLVEENPKKIKESSPLIAKKKGKSPVNELSDTKPDKKKKVTEADEKKQSAAKFLNRMKRSNETLLNTSERGGDGKKDQVGKKGSRVKEQGSPGKRNVGRPPKISGGKRNRESLDSEKLDSKQTKKRSKR